MLDALLHGGGSLLGVWGHPGFEFRRGDIRAGRGRPGRPGRRGRGGPPRRDRRRPGLRPRAGAGDRGQPRGVAAPPAGDPARRGAALHLRVHLQQLRADEGPGAAGGRDLRAGPGVAVRRDQGGGGASRVGPGAGGRRLRHGATPGHRLRRVPPDAVRSDGERVHRGDDRDRTPSRVRRAVLAPLRARSGRGARHRAAAGAPRAGGAGRGVQRRRDRPELSEATAGGADPTLCPDSHRRVRPQGRRPARLSGVVQPDFTTGWDSESPGPWRTASAKSSIWCDPASVGDYTEARYRN